MHGSTEQKAGESLHQRSKKVGCSEITSGILSLGCQLVFHLEVEMELSVGLTSGWVQGMGS